jgi:hypothetical protein
MVRLIYSEQSKLDGFDMIAFYDWAFLACTTKAFLMHFYMTVAERPSSTYDPVTNRIYATMLKVCHQSNRDPE